MKVIYKLRVMILRKMMNKLEDKNYYHIELITDKDVKKYKRLSDKYFGILNKILD